MDLGAEGIMLLCIVCGKTNKTGTNWDINRDNYKFLDLFNAWIAGN